MKLIFDNVLDLFCPTLAQTDNPVEVVGNKLNGDWFIQKEVYIYKDYIYMFIDELIYETIVYRN